MKRIISLLLLAYVMISCVACQTPTEKPEETTKAAVEWRVDSPEDLRCTEEDQQIGRAIHSGIYYYEGGGRFLYVANDDHVYRLVPMRGTPDDFFDGLVSGDKIAIVAVETVRGQVYSFEKIKQLAVSEKGDSSKIPAEILDKFVEADSPYQAQE